MDRFADLRKPMSSKPDGNDPRILQPEGETVLIASTTRQSKGRKYHKPGCDSLDEIKGGPKEIDIAVARWKNMNPCTHCIEEFNSARIPEIEGPTVDKWRKSLAWADISVGNLASVFEFSPRTISSHVKATRDYNYKKQPTTPTVAYDHEAQTWVWDNE